MTITIGEKRLMFDDRFAKHYEKVYGESFKDAVPYYLCTSTGAFDVKEAVKNKREDELQELVQGAIEDELRLNGVPYHE